MRSGTSDPDQLLHPDGGGHGEEHGEVMEVEMDDNRPEFGQLKFIFFC
jgi:hypothetical protein